MTEKKEIEFETALKKLESIVGNLEAGDLSLDDALKQYEEGVKMADVCSKRLTEAEKRVEVLMKTDGGRFKTEPFGKEVGKLKKSKNSSSSERTLRPRSGSTP